MFKWLEQRVIDITVALVIIAILAWLLVTQPVSEPEKHLAIPAVPSQQLEGHLQELLAIKEQPEGSDPAIGRVAAFLGRELSELGRFESVMSSPGLYQLKLQFGKLKPKQRQVLVVHHVVTEQPSGRGIKALVTLVALAKQLAAIPADQFAAEIRVFLHAPERLAITLKEAGKLHIESLVQQRTKNYVLVWTPSILLPDILPESSRWGFLTWALPDQYSDLALYGRVLDFQWLRQLKAVFYAAEIPEVESLTVFNSFPKVQRFPLTAYWEKGISATLLRTDYVGQRSDYPNVMRLLAALTQISTTTVVEK